MKIRKALENELPWINKKYDEVAFVHSRFENEIIAIAEVDGEKAGIGRLVSLDNDNLELGGIYVFEKFRGKGIAHKIVEFLLKSSKPNKTIYCIPFAKLSTFYKKFGFAPCRELKEAPQDIVRKIQWCQRSYEEHVELLFKSV
jgi:N-acetylglutamate synthase-like GNAT family acetyltransferase